MRNALPGIQTIFGAGGIWSAAASPARGMESMIELNAAASERHWQHIWRMATGVCTPWPIVFIQPFCLVNRYQAEVAENPYRIRR